MGNLSLFLIPSAHNIIIVHPTWFYPSSGMKNKSPESQYFGQFFFFFLLFDADYANYANLMRISKNWGMANPTLKPNMDNTM